MPSNCNSIQTPTYLIDPLHLENAQYLCKIKAWFVRKCPPRYIWLFGKVNNCDRHLKHRVTKAWSIEFILCKYVVALARYVGLGKGFGLSVRLREAKRNHSFSTHSFSLHSQYSWLKFKSSTSYCNCQHCVQKGVNRSFLASGSRVIPGNGMWHGWRIFSTGVGYWWTAGKKTWHGVCVDLNDGGSSWLFLVKRWCLMWHCVRSFTRGSNNDTYTVYLTFRPEDLTTTAACCNQRPVHNILWGGRLAKTTHPWRCSVTPTHPLEFDVCMVTHTGIEYVPTTWAVPRVGVRCPSCVRSVSKCDFSNVTWLSNDRVFTHAKIDSITNLPLVSDYVIFSSNFWSESRAHQKNIGIVLLDLPIGPRSGANVCTVKREVKRGKLGSFIFSWDW